MILGFTEEPTTTTKKFINTHRSIIHETAFQRSLVLHRKNLFWHFQEQDLIYPVFKQQPRAMHGSRHHYTAEFPSKTPRWDPIYNFPLKAPEYGASQTGGAMKLKITKFNTTTFSGRERKKKQKNKNKWPCSPRSQQKSLKNHYYSCRTSSGTVILRARSNLSHFKQQFTQACHSASWTQPCTTRSDFTQTTFL